MNESFMQLQNHIKYTFATVIGVGCFGLSTAVQKSPIRPSEVLIAYPHDPYRDWSRTLRTYLNCKYDICGTLIEIDLLDPQATNLPLYDQKYVIIPMQVGVTKMISEMRLSNTILCTDPETYFKLDDKSEMTNLSLSGIPQLPTLKLQDATEETLKEFLTNYDRHEQFIVKPNDGAGSAEQQLFSNHDELYLSLGKDAVLQPFFTDHQTIEFNFFALDGVIQDWICTISDEGGLSEEMWSHGLQLKTYNDPDVHEIVQFSKSIVKKYNIQGLMEFEFLKLPGKKQSIFLLEVNPRISSSVVAFDDNGDSAYIDRLVVPYLQHFGLAEDVKIEKKNTSQSFRFPPENTANQWWISNFQSRAKS